MKKLFAFLLTCSFAVLALTPLAFMGGEVSQVANAENEIVTVSTEDELKTIANSVNAETEEERNDYAGVTIVLQNDIELSQSWTPIGMVDRPFKGTFEGNGFTISNVKIDGSYTYQGLFGYTNGATISNLNIAGEFYSAFSSQDEVYVGVLVGNAVNTQIINCEINAILNNELTISNKTTFGSVAGRLDGGSVTNALNYMPINLQFNLLNVYTIKVGGIAGVIDNAVLTKVANFGAITSGTKNNASTIYVGGIAGEIQGSLTKIKDCVSGATINANSVNQDNYLVGNVVANIAVAPVSGNISSVAYYDNSHEAFANQGNYTFVNVGTNDYVMRVTRAVLYAQDFYSSPSYAFEISGNTYNFAWNEDTANWDFVNIYVMVSNGSVTELRLQIFQNFTISFAAALDSGNLLQVEGENKVENVPYGDKATLTFTFKDQNERLYQQISEIYCNGQELHYAQFTKDEQGGMVSPDGDVVLKINESEDATNFVLTVTATSTTEGVYSFALQPITYNMYVVAGEGNGGVRYTGVSNISSILSRQITSASSAVNVEAVAGNMYAFTNWSLYYLTDTVADEDLAENQINVDGKTWALASWTDAEQSKQNPLSITFATGDFNQSFLLMANFVNDPCTLSFTFDSNFINRVEVEDQVVTQSAGSVMVDKNQSITLRIVANAGATIDTGAFEQSLRKLFVIENASINTTSYQDPNDSNLTVYEFSFSTASINYTNTSTFSLTINASVAENGGDNNTVWIIVGVVGGVVVLAGIGIVIWLVLRNRGGGSGSKKVKSDDYKKYYY